MDTSTPAGERGFTVSAQSRSWNVALIVERASSRFAEARAKAKQNRPTQIRVGWVISLSSGHSVSSDWIGHATGATWQKNLGLHESTFDGFPKEEVYFASGSVRRANSRKLAGASRLATETHKFRMLAGAPHAIFKGDVNGASIPHVPKFENVTGVISIRTGALRELHGIRNADEWKSESRVILSVTLSVTGRFRTERMARRRLGYIPQGIGHRVKTSG